MDYPAGSILGTEVTTSLREAGFKGVIAIRSANDEPASRKMYLDAGSSGYLSKTANPAKLVRDLMQIYSRIFEMGLCDA